MGGSGLLGRTLDGHGLRLPQRAQHILQGVRPEGDIRSYREVRLPGCPAQCWVPKAVAGWRHANFLLSRNEAADSGTEIVI